MWMRTLIFLGGPGRGRLKWPSDRTRRKRGTFALISWSPGQWATFAPACRGVVALALLAGAVPAAGQPPLPITFLQHDGTAVDAHLAGFSAGGLRIFDTDRRLTSLDPGTAAVLTLRPEGDAGSQIDPAATLPVPPLGVLRLTDGQRLAGAWAGPADGGESLRWTHPTFGTVVVPLDQVAGWATDGATPRIAPDPAGGDVVVLTRGERLSGFLYLPESAEPNDPAIHPGDGDVLMLSPADDPDGPAVPVPAASVAAVMLANPPNPAGSSDPARVTLRDGSRLFARALTLGTADAAFDARIAGQSLRVAVPADAVRRVVFTDGGRDAYDLADLPARIPPPPAASTALWGPHVAGASVVAGGYQLAAPARLAVALPPDAVVVVGRAVLDLPGDIATDRAAWAGCTLRIEGTPPVELALDAARPDAPFRVSVPAGTTELVFTLDPGPRGPVLDTVVLRIEDAVVLTGPS